MYKSCLQSALMLIEFCFCYQNKWNLCQLNRECGREGTRGIERRGDLLVGICNYFWNVTHLSWELCITYAIAISFTCGQPQAERKGVKKRQRESKRERKHRGATAARVGMQGICHKCQCVGTLFSVAYFSAGIWIYNTFIIRPVSWATNWAVAAAHSIAVAAHHAYAM